MAKVAMTCLLATTYALFAALTWRTIDGSWPLFSVNLATAIAFGCGLWMGRTTEWPS